MFQNIKINTKLLPIKVHYFLYNAGLSPVAPFLSTYARQLGFSSVVIGFIYMILPIINVIGNLALSTIADQFKCKKVFFLTSLAVTAIAFLGFNFSPDVPLTKEARFMCANRTTIDTSTIKDSIIDNCLVENLKNDHKITDCQLNCPMTEQVWNTITNCWGVSANGSTTWLKFTAHINKSETFQTGEILNFVVTSVTIDSFVHDPVCSMQNCQFSSICEIKCSESDIDELVTKSSINDSQVYGMYQFWVFFALMVVQSVAEGVTGSTGDALCMEMLGDEPHKFGYQRLFGSLGWGTFTLLSGVIIDALSPGLSKKKLEPAFYMAAVILTLDFLASSRLQYEQTKESRNIFKDVSKLFINWNIILVFICCVFVGMCTGLLYDFRFFLVEDLTKNYGCDSQQRVKTLEGLIMTVQTLFGEVPFFFLSGKVLKKIGHVNAMNLALVVFGVRFLLYSLIPNPWWFLLVDLLHGPAFGLFSAAMTSYTSIVAPAGTEVTMQAVMGVIFSGVGQSSGSAVGGVLYRDYGGIWLFRIFGIAAFIMFLLYSVASFVIKRYQQNATVVAENVGRL